MIFETENLIIWGNTCYRTYRKKGYEPQEEHPLSFVLQGSEYLDAWFDNGITTKVPLAKIASEHISCTLGDSMAMWKYSFGRMNTVWWEKVNE